jgi:hypothetical protein
MKYYLTVVQNPGEVGEVANIYSYDREEDAFALYHNELAVRSDTRNGTMCKIFTDGGSTVSEETYVKSPVQENATYYVLIIQNQGEQTEADAVYRRANYDESLALFHSELGYRHETRNSTIVSILNVNGVTVKDGSYIKTVSE